MLAMFVVTKDDAALDGKTPKSAKSLLSERKDSLGAASANAHSKTERSSKYDSSSERITHS
jgi:hypothetical protein